MPAFVIVEVPFHMGLEDAGVGRGPARFLAAGADRALESDSAPAQVLHVRKLDNSTTGIDAIVDLNRQIRGAVRQALADGVCPVVLAGNCNSALGSIAGVIADIGAARAGIVWLDAHGDFNTPETSLSGMLDGMALAAAVGHCHEDLRERIGMDASVAEENVLLLGWRDLDPEESRRLEASAITTFGARELDDVERVLADWKLRVDAVYLHVDIDFLDPAESPGANFRGPGGLPLERAEQLLASIVRELPVAVIALTNHNPDSDPRGLTAAAGVRLLRAMAAACPSPAPR
jgi:arginase